MLCLSLTAQDPEAALADFLQRVANYEKVYEPITEDDLSYIKLYNVGEKVRGREATHTHTHTRTRARTYKSTHARTYTHTHNISRRILMSLGPVDPTAVTLIDALPRR
jgi:hypothetical protein